MSKTAVSNEVTVSPQDLPITFRVRTAFKAHLENLEIPQTDMFVITHMEHTSFGNGILKLNELTDGAVLSQIEDVGFQGLKGEFLLIEVPDSSIKNVLVVGIGSADDVKRTTICALYRLAFEQAKKIGAKKITIPFFPGLLFDLNYRGMLAVLHCRIGERVRANALGDLEEIEILCTSQARKHIVDGLEVSKQLCPTCRDPKLT